MEKEEGIDRTQMSQSSVLESLKNIVTDSSVFYPNSINQIVFRCIPFHRSHISIRTDRRTDTYSDLNFRKKKHPVI